MIRAAYRAWSTKTDDGNVILVVDISSDTLVAKSVTNDAENVVREVVRTYGDHPIAYQDTDGRWDMLVHEHGKFTGFAPITSATILKAVVC